MARPIRARWTRASGFCVRLTCAACSPAVELPALVIAGQRDRLTPAAAGRALASMLPNARFVEIAHGGHAPFLSHGRQVLDQVLGFLRRGHVPLPTVEPA